LNTLFR